jgi:hypothetical protein
VLATSLVAAQLGLVTIWTILGSAKWTFRWPAGLLLTTVTAILVVRQEYLQSEALVALVGQTLVLALLCGLLSWRGFRLALEPQATSSQPVTIAAGSAPRPLPGTQFGVRDLLWWTTSLAIVLAIGRALDFVPASRLAVEWLGTSARLADWQSILTTSILTAIVLVVALWAGLGAGPVLARCSLLALVSIAAALAYAIPHFREATRWAAAWSWSPPMNLTFWDPQYRSWFYSSEWANMAWFWLAGGLTFAALLMFRALGYRLCRSRLER